MNRLLNVNNYHYRRGGAEVVYFEHAELMQQLGWENAFFAMHHPDNLASDWSGYFVDEIQIERSYTLGEKISKASKVIYSFEAKKKISRLIRDFDPTIAHVHNIYHHISPSILQTLSKHGVPTIMTAHDVKLVCPNNKMLSPKGVCEECKGGKYYRAVVNKCVHGSVPASTIIAAESYLHHALNSYRKYVDRFVVPSKFLINKFVEWGWDANQFLHIPNFAKLDGVTPQFAPGDYFCYFGRLSFEKGIHTLIDAAALSGIHLVVVGSGPLDDIARERAVKAGANIEFLGFKTGIELESIVANSKATILPSEWYENAPLSILESYALGKPVIGAEIGGIPEMIHHGQTGWVYPSGHTEKLAETLKMVEDMPLSRIEEMGRHANHVVKEKYSPQAYQQSMAQLYTQF